MYCGNVNNRLVEKNSNIKLANCDIQAVKSKPLYWKIYSIHPKDLIDLDIWRRIFQLNFYSGYVTFQNNLSMLR